MNRNDNFSFAGLPALNLPRSTFPRHTNRLLTSNFGDIVPFYLDEVLAGDTHSVDTAFVCRMSTPLYPVMDNAFVDIYYFFVPTRLVWENFESFRSGQAQPDAYEGLSDLTVPTVDNGAGPYSLGDLADYMHLPVGQGLTGYNISCLPFRAYALIYNEWFRDQNLIDPVVIDFGDTNNSSNNEAYYIENGYSLLKASKFHDYFTSCLPSPQKGVAAGIEFNLPTTLSGTNAILSTPSGSVGVVFSDKSDGNLNGSASFLGSNLVAGSTLGKIKGDFAFDPDVSSISVSINDLRNSIATQHILEALARGGNRYTEFIRQFFGVVSPDSRLQRPEYLGGKRVPINVTQVLQMSASVDGGTPLGETGAFSLTSNVDSSFTYSATEDGYIIGLCVARTNHTYQQGIPKLFLRRNRFDFYNPLLAHIGEQPVYTIELFAEKGTPADDVFGYQEAFADLRYNPNRVAGYFRSGVSGSLDAWHYADDYASAPQLSQSWIEEPVSNVDRTLAVTSSKTHQLIWNFAIHNNCTRVLPVYSVPGLERI